VNTPRPGWKQLVRQVVERLPETFSLSDVLGRRDFFAAHYPSNRFIDAKIRQSLQILRDQGAIAFLGSGLYRRLDIAPTFSPLLAPELAAALSSAAQSARVVLETWAEMNMYCLACQADSLERLAANTPVADFECGQCSSRYQLKGKNGRFGRFITGAAYEPTRRAAQSGTMPEHLLVEFDLRYATVVFVEAIPGNAITEARVVPRKPLRETARRAGWQGCTIDTADLPRARVVEPAAIDRASVRFAWAKIQPV
jgi:hypothetical protein